jgi:DNA repair exonuclease SbcCD ATPase subunit
MLSLSLLLLCVYVCMRLFNLHVDSGIGMAELLEKKLFELDAHKQRLSATQQDLSQERSRVSEAESERDAAAKEAMSLSEMLGRNEQDIETLKESLALARQQKKEEESRHNELKRLLDSLSLQYKQEGDETIERVKDIEERLSHLQSELFSKVGLSV